LPRACGNPPPWPTLPFAIGYDAVGEIDQETDGVGGQLGDQAVMAALWPGQHPGYAVLPEASEKTFLLMPGGGRPENEKGASCGRRRPF